MARIEDCKLGTRVKLTDGWGGPASVIERYNRTVPDIVLMQVEAPVWDGPHHKILAFSCSCEELTLL